MRFQDKFWFFLHLFLRYEFLQNLENVAKKLGLPYPWSVLDIFSGKSKVGSYRVWQLLRFGHWYIKPLLRNLRLNILSFQFPTHLKQYFQRKICLSICQSVPSCPLPCHLPPKSHMVRVPEAQSDRWCARWSRAKYTRF